jgi:hypothetical protein
MDGRFQVTLIKPSHYDDDGYVIQWWKASIPANSLASLYAIVQDAADRRVLGEATEIAVEAWDECNAVIRPRRIARAITAAGGGLAMLVGVQTNQFPRALDLARELRGLGVAVVIGGFHVSGCLAMLPQRPPDLEEALSLGVSLFAGEAEGRVDTLLRDAASGRLQPIYNHMDALPALEGTPGPVLPADRLRRYSPPIGSFDAGRGCPFQCSFCTIINVQGRKSRHRSADDVERLIRQHSARGVRRFFITDDDFARNRNWEAILDRIIALREAGGLELRFIIQVDALAYRLPRFVEKCRRAGVRRVFIGLENINPENLLQAKKRQNHVAEYRRMLQEWRAAGIITYCGYILGFPADSVASIERDIAVIQRELPVDLLEFFLLTPLPGSEDHQRLAAAGAWMEPDMNRYDLEHVTAAHPRMDAAAWQDIYARAWRLYYSPEHIATILRRAVASGLEPDRLMLNIVQFLGTPTIEGLHPLQGGYLRRKRRSSRRPGLPPPPPVLFHARRLAETALATGRMLALLWRVDRIRRRVLREARQGAYTDVALSTLSPEAEEGLALLRPAPPLAVAGE